jgi:hypothetical protein
MDGPASTLQTRNMENSLRIAGIVVLKMLRDIARLLMFTAATLFTVGVLCITAWVVISMARASVDSLNNYIHVGDRDYIVLCIILSLMYYLLILACINYTCRIINESVEEVRNKRVDVVEFGDNPQDLEENKPLLE